MAKENDGKELGVRAINVDVAIWEKAKKKAAAEEISLSAAIRAFLEVYVARPGK